MPTATVLQVLTQIGHMSDTEQNQLYAALTPWLAMRQSLITTSPILNELRESRFAKGMKCPHCQAAHVQRWGKTANRQRYRCTQCQLHQAPGQVASSRRLYGGGPLSSQDG